MNRDLAIVEEDNISNFAPSDITGMTKIVNV
jgi:hypothetical protein